MCPHFTRLLSIYVLNFNAEYIYIYIYLVSCLVEINLYNLYFIFFLYMNSFCYLLCEHIEWVASLIKKIGVLQQILVRKYHVTRSKNANETFAFHVWQTKRLHSTSYKPNVCIPRRTNQTFAFHVVQTKRLHSTACKPNRIHHSVCTAYAEDVTTFC